MEKSLLFHNVSGQADHVLKTWNTFSATLLHVSFTLDATLNGLLGQGVLSLPKTSSQTTFRLFILQKAHLANLTLLFLDCLA